MAATAYKAFFVMPHDQFASWLVRRKANSVFFGLNGPDDCFLCPDMDLAVALSATAFAKAAFETRAFALSGRQQDALLRRFMIQDIQDSNGIEGIVTTKREIVSALGGIVGKPSEKNGRIASFVNFYRELNQAPEASFPEDMSQIRSIWDSLIGKDLREKEVAALRPDGMFFRKQQVCVTNGMESVDRGFFPESKIIDGLGKALAALRRHDIPLFARLAIFHYFFERIHPFYDGNGRTGRYLLSLFLKSQGDHWEAFRVSHALGSHRSAYYRAFKETKDPRNQGDLGTFVLPFLNMVKAQCEEDARFISAATKESNEAMRFADSLPGKGNRAVARLLAEISPFAETGMPIEALSEATGLSAISVRRILLRLRKEYPQRFAVAPIGRRLCFRLTAHGEPDSLGIQELEMGD